MEHGPTTGLFGGFGGPTFDLSPSSHEDDFDDFGNMSDDGDSPEQVDSAAGPKRKSRRLPSTAEKRANHNAIERARRESLNGRFMELAQALPTMSVSKRPSKNAIVLNSLEFVKNARAREQALEAENTCLRKEVNELRAKLGMKALDKSVPTTVTSQAPTLSAVKSEAPVARLAPVVTAEPQLLPGPVPVTAGATTVAKPSSLSRPHSATNLVKSTASMIVQDPMAVSGGFFGFVDPFAAQVKVEASSPQDSTSDSEISLVNTPPSFHSFETSPSFFFEETVHAPSTTFDNDFLAQCGLQSGLPAATMSGMPGWPNPAMGLHFGAPANNAFPLFA